MVFVLQRGTENRDENKCIYLVPKIARHCEKNVSHASDLRSFPLLSFDQSLRMFHLGAMIESWVECVLQLYGASNSKPFTKHLTIYLKPTNIKRADENGGNYQI